MHCLRLAGPGRFRDPIVQFVKPGRTRYYRDTSYQWGEKCSQRMVAAAVIEGQAAAILSSIQLRDDWQERITTLLATPEEIAGAEGRRREILARPERLKRLYVLGDLDESDYLAHSALLKARLPALRPRFLQEVSGAAEALSNLPRIWNAAMAQEKKELLGSAFEAVYVRDLRIEAVKPRPAFRCLFELQRRERRDSNPHLVNTLRVPRLRWAWSPQR